MQCCDVAVLGAGPAGLMAARRLAGAGRSVVVLEAATSVGGMAGSFEIAGVRVDFGSHRLHPTSSPHLLADLQALLGDDLQTRRRHGRIALQGRWLRFPLQLGDLARNLPRRFVAGVAVDTALSPLRSAALRSRQAPNAVQAIEARLGPTVARSFYTPYLTKLWGTDPEQLGRELADRRVSARSPLALAAKALRTRRETDGAGTFRYPRRGFGQISEAVAAAATNAGADIRLGAAVTQVALDEAGATITLPGGRVVRAAALLSSIPVAALAHLAGAPSPVLAAAGRLRHRAMVLAYLVLDTDRLTPFDAHYFPEMSTPVSRMSEPKNYRDDPKDPSGVTVVCAELPCWEGDDVWTASVDELRALVVSTLEPLGLRFPRVLDVQVRRIPRCYPVYTGSYEADLAGIEDWAAQQPRLVTFGRQGLYNPDNTHHTLEMGEEAAAAVRADGTIDRVRWDAARERFRANVVED